MRFITAVISTQLVLMSVAQSFAADPAPDEQQLIPQAPEVRIDTSQWGGFYLGAYGSYSWFSANVDGVEGDDEAFGGGGYVGYNWQFENDVVTGLEANAGLASASTNVAGTTVNQDWDASLRARLGYAYENSLIYSFAGFAVSGVEANALTGTDDQTLSGFNVGAGFETELFENVTGRLEYGFSDYSADGFALGGATPSNIGLENQNVNIGIGFKF